MHAFWTRLIWLIVVCALGSCARAQDDKLPLGLTLATPEQLRGVPLAAPPYSGAEPPRQIDLTRFLPPVGNQGRQQSCVGWATAYAMKTLQESQESGQSPTRGDGMPDPSRVFSPTFIYNQINRGMDHGSLFSDAFAVLERSGAATLEVVPYTEHDHLTRPSAATLEHASRYRIGTWRQVNVRSVQELKAHLAAGFPVIFGAAVDRAFFYKRDADPWTSLAGPPEGAHAMILVGYDDSREAFRLMNSWGREWGDGGYAWVTYDFFTRHASEAYVAQDLGNTPPPAPDARPDTRPDTWPSPDRPAPLPAERPRVVIRNVMHNVPNQQLGLGMWVEGSIRPGIATRRRVQIVVQMFYANGQPVPGIGYPFQTATGVAATTTGEGVFNEDTEVPWQVFMPYAMLATQQGQMVMMPQVDMWGNWYQVPVYQPARTNFLADAVLYVDGMGESLNLRFPFYIDR